MGAQFLKAYLLNMFFTPLVGSPPMMPQNTRLPTQTRCQGFRPKWSSRLQAEGVPHDMPPAMDEPALRVPLAAEKQRSIERNLGC